MAGSYSHVVNKKGKLLSNKKFIKMIENLGDAYEAVEEMWHIIDILAEGDKNKIFNAYLEYLRRVGGNAECAEKYKPKWARES